MLKKFTEKSDREISDNYKELYEKVIEIFSYKLPSVIHYIRKLAFSKESIVSIINIFYSDKIVYYEKIGGILCILQLNKLLKNGEYLIEE